MTVAENLTANDRWFSESEVLWPGQRFSLAVKDIVLKQKSKYQDILVFDSETYGRVLVLDGVIQLTERDEFAYQEMLVHVPMFSHENPKSVCIIGGGDGGMLREVCKHTSVEKIIMCEIDREVVEVSKKYFSTTMATGFQDPRLELLFDDGAKFLRESGHTFDVIIVDSSDPVGPAETLFEKEFYITMRKALNPGGIVCTQGECMWLHLDLIETLKTQSEDIYASVHYGYLTIPSYPSGQIGFLICCASSFTDPQDPNRLLTSSCPSAITNTLRYYTPKLHKACFILPRFVEDKLISNPTVKQKPFTQLVCNKILSRKQLGGVLTCVFAAGFILGTYLSRR